MITIERVSDTEVLVYDEYSSLFKINNPKRVTDEAIEEYLPFIKEQMEIEREKFKEEGI